MWAFNFFLKVKQGLKIKEQFDPFLVFLVSMLKLSPNIMLIPFKQSRVITYMPLPITSHTKIIFAIKWVLKLLRDKYRVINLERVVELLSSSIYSRGLSYLKKEEFYEVATRNRHLLNNFIR